MSEYDVYLGDGVYASFEPMMGQIKLYTMEGNVIYLNNDNLPALLAYIKKLTGEE